MLQSAIDVCQLRTDIQYLGHNQQHGHRQHPQQYNQHQHYRLYILVQCLVEASRWFSAFLAPCASPPVVVVDSAQPLVVVVGDAVGAGPS